MDSADAWIANGGKSPAIILAKNGYDVWIANSRGNKYSKRHSWMSIESEQYWEFSWEEMAVHDLPAMTDYILFKTGYSKLAFVGH